MNGIWRNALPPKTTSPTRSLGYADSTSQACSLAAASLVSPARIAHSHGSGEIEQQQDVPPRAHHFALALAQLRTGQCQQTKAERGDPEPGGGPRLPGRLQRRAPAKHLHLAEGRQRGAARALGTAEEPRRQRHREEAQREQPGIGEAHGKVLSRPPRSARAAARSARAGARSQGKSSR